MGGRGSRERPAFRAIAALVVSAAVNAAALAALHSAGAFTLAARAASAARVGLAAVSGERWRANRAIDGQPVDPEPGPPPAASPTPRQIATRPDPRGEVVAAPPSPDPRTPQRWRFLSDHDGRARRDVQSRDAGKRRWDTPLARATPGPQGAQGLPERGEEGTSDASAPGRVGASAARETPEDAIARARRALAPSPDGEASTGRPDVAAGEAPAPTPGEGGARKAGRYDPRLLPNASTFERLAGGPGERLSDVEEGDATALNTRRFRFAEFFLRVKSAIAREWDPNRAWDARDPTAQRYGRRTRGAVVDIVLDPEGDLRDVRVVHGSGIDFYDREVVRAIRAAAPFPNPPRALVGEDGRILLARWRFELAWGDALPRLALPGVKPR
ncbi:MAG TPA: TonB family protein [Anaeromyxobacter sp.]|nr:TonB family protein [Anaeromyxobacter sp.]